MKIRRMTICILLATATLASAIGKTDQQQIDRDQIYRLFEAYDQAKNDRQIRDRLDGLAEHLQLNPSSRVYVISYGGLRSCRGEARLRAQLTTRYLHKAKGINRSRVIIVDGGHRDAWQVELWVGDRRSVPPLPMETIKKRLVRITKKCDLGPITLLFRRN